MRECPRKPIPPSEPDPLDCCGEGCARCIYDVYDDALAEYRKALARWEVSCANLEPPDAGSADP